MHVMAENYKQIQTHTHTHTHTHTRAQDNHSNDNIRSTEAHKYSETVFSVDTRNRFLRQLKQVPVCSVQPLDACVYEETFIALALRT